MAKIMCVVGARPNFMKIAPILDAIKAHGSSISAYLVHTGQHYDADMKARFFGQLGIPEPDKDLEVGSGTHAVQTAEVMKRFELVVDAEKPDAVLVVGDVNSTIACALVAAKKEIPVIHVEAGLRSYDRAMPEEINRVLTDQISDLLFTTERSAHDNLAKEGIAAERVIFVGNVMIDTLMRHLKQAQPLADTVAVLPQPELFTDSESGFALLTMHRPSNVDVPEVFQRLLQTVRRVSDRLPVLFPVHPRTASKIKEFGFESIIDTPRIQRLPPLGYLELLGVMSKARLVLTDSGGIQEETTALGIPCITMRENTERPITVTEGTNTVVGTDPAKIEAVVDEVFATGGKAGRVPEYWDGRAAERIVAELEQFFARK